MQASKECMALSICKNRWHASHGKGKFFVPADKKQVQAYVSIKGAHQALVRFTGASARQKQVLCRQSCSLFFKKYDFFSL